MSVHDRPCGCRIYPAPKPYPDRLCQYHEGYAQGFADAVNHRFQPVPVRGDLTEGNRP